MMGHKMMRLQKWLSRKGLCSRRQAEEHIRDGRVMINGRPAVLGDRVLAGSEVVFQGQAITVTGPADDSIDPSCPVPVYLLHKPAGYLVSRVSQGGKKTIYDLPSVRQLHNSLPQHVSADQAKNIVASGGLLPSVGRLDFLSEGLLLLTRDGDLSQRLTHPRYQCEKHYVVALSSSVPAHHLRELIHGARLKDGLVEYLKVRPRQLSSLPIWLRQESLTSELHWYETLVREGRKHIVRRLWRSLGYEVQRLIRLRVGPFELPSDLTPGDVRVMNAPDLA